MTSGPSKSIQNLPDHDRDAVIIFLSIKRVLKNLGFPFNKTVNPPDLFILRLARALFPEALLAAGLIVGLAACKTPPAATAPAPAPVEVSRTAPDEPTKAIPPDLYKNMPMYPDAVVEHVHKPKGAMREIVFSAHGQMPQMVAFYKEEFKKNDFHITSSLTMPARHTWSCDFHYNGRPGSIMLYPSDTDKSLMTIDLIYELPAKIDESLMEPKEDFDVVGPGEIAQKAPQAPNPAITKRGTNDMALLDGKVAVITGAGRGIGREEALLIAKHGAKIVVNDLGGHFDGTGQSRSPAEDVVKEIRAAGGEAVANFESVTDFKAAKRIIECAIDNFGKLNIVVNNAGILRDRMIFNMSEEDWDAVVGGPSQGLVQHRAPCLRAYWREQHKDGQRAERPDHQHQLRLGHARQCRPGNYGAAKAARRGDGDHRGSRDEPLRRHRQRDRAGRAHPPDGRCDAADRRRHGARRRPVEWTPFTPAHVAPLVAWLASDDAKDVHGEVFRVGMGTVWLMQGWHSVGQGSKNGAMWEPAELGVQAQGGARPRALPRKRAWARSMGGGAE